MYKYCDPESGPFQRSFLRSPHRVQVCQLLENICECDLETQF